MLMIQYEYENRRTMEKTAHDALERASIASCELGDIQATGSTEPELHSYHSTSYQDSQPTKSMKTYKTLHDIRARVTARWKHPRCKFQRGELVLVNELVCTSGYVSQIKQARVGRMGHVRAVSCLPDGRIRSNLYRTNQPTRMYTRYYVQFADDTILGYDSHHLDLVKLHD